MEWKQGALINCSKAANGMVPVLWREEVRRTFLDSISFDPGCLVLNYFLDAGISFFANSVIQTGLHLPRGKGNPSLMKVLFLCQGLSLKFFLLHLDDFRCQHIFSYIFQHLKL